MRFVSLFLAAAVCLSISVSAGRSQDPVPPGPAVTPTIEQLIAKLTDLRKQRADVEKAEAAVAADIRARVKELTDKLAKLGLVDVLPPGPGPNPPVPVPPVPPVPVDPLKQKLRVGFDLAAGTATQKREWAKELAALYRAAAKLVVNPELATAGQLKDKLREAAASLIGADSLKEVRQAVAVELAGVLPTTEGELTDEQRKAAAVLFGKLASLLDAIAVE